jgi:hypothetical protein
MMRGRASLVVAMVFFARAASAQPSQADALAAESLFRDAKALVTAGKTSEACPKFAESQRLDPQLGTLLHLATCHAQEGKTASAWAEFLQAADQAAAAHDGQREKIARDRADKLAPTVPRLTIEIDTANPPLTISLDGQTVHASNVPIPIDPGKHVVDASAPERKKWSQSVEIASSTTLKIPRLESDSVASPPAPIAPPPEPERGGSSLRYVGYGAAGLGIVAIGIGTVFGIKSLSDKRASDDACPPRGCTPAGLQSYDDARSAARIADIAIAVGVVALAAGVVLVLTSPSSRSSMRNPTRITF